MIIFSRTFWVSVIVHISVLLILIIVPAILKFCSKKEPHEIITYVDLNSVAPSLPKPVEVEEITIPEPPPEPEPAVIKPPVVEPPPTIPEPPPKPEKPKPKKRKKIEKSKQRIKRQSTEKPEPTPKLHTDEIKKMLAIENNKPQQAGQQVSAALPAWYYAIVRQTLYNVWQQPSGLSASAGHMVRVSLRVAKDGRILRRKQIRKSGVRIMDESVNTAINSITELRPLPEQFTKDYEDITIDFELTSN